MAKVICQIIVVAVIVVVVVVISVITELLAIKYILFRNVCSFWKKK